MRAKGRGQNEELTLFYHRLFWSVSHTEYIKFTERGISQQKSLKIGNSSISLVCPESFSLFLNGLWEMGEKVKRNIDLRRKEHWGTS